ncbi:putative RNA methyltransferase [Salisediminibacterium selenitireducens]|uniref:putative RNA methyltransferase n=1 Tax=Salisediminibacterium selenitireducens TaxID=85683 RepID=UPI00030F359C|nr:methyltransferase domain-containing protein [Salisediminibacterium selenitireducens]
MNKKERGIRNLYAWNRLLSCPVCQGSVSVVPEGRLVCGDGHSFDVARQGYVNVLTGAVNSAYSKELFHARAKVIQETPLYRALHKNVGKLMDREAKKQDGVYRIGDFGCGEGSHLALLLEGRSNWMGAGLDLSKEGIQAATDHEDTPAVWLAADLVNVPLKTGSLDVALTILSPSNYKEMKRVLKPGGLAVKVIPGPGYMKEIRDFFQQNRRDAKENEALISRFEEAFDDVKAVSVKTAPAVTAPLRKELCRMSPLAWHAEEGEKERYEKEGAARLTMDLVVLTGRLPQ